MNPILGLLGLEGLLGVTPVPTVLNMKHTNCAVYTNLFDLIS